MHPAFSVLFFTVTSGVGYGLFMLLILFHLTGVGELVEPGQIAVIGLASLGLISAGLLSSTFHLANPKNAWRAFNRFKTSWLSREGVFAVLYYPIALAYLLAVWLSGGDVNAFVIITGVLTVILGLVTTFSTGMIYASLKTIKQWHTPLTPVNYLLFSGMSGAIFLNAVHLAVIGNLPDMFLITALVLIVIGVIAKVVYFYWIGKPSGSSIKTATTFTQGSVRLLDTGHTSDNFLQKEFGFNVDGSTLSQLRNVVLLVVFILPFLVVAFGLAGSGAPSLVLSIAAALAVYAGLILERWLFFAEARHVIRMFYGEQST